VNALDTCNVCDVATDRPNQFGYCDQHLAEMHEAALTRQGFAVSRLGSLVLGSKKVGSRGFQVTILPDGRITGMVVGNGIPRRITAAELKEAGL
jgi:hypothetical protein